MILVPTSLRYGLPNNSISSLSFKELKGNRALPNIIMASEEVVHLLALTVTKWPRSKNNIV